MKLDRCTLLLEVERAPIKAWNGMKLLTLFPPRGFRRALSPRRVPSARPLRLFVGAWPLVGDVRESCALRLSSYGIYVRERERWARSMRTCALALRVRERNKYILMTSEKIYSNLSSIADEAGTRLIHGGHLAQRGDSAIPRARARSKHLDACVPSEARACGQKRLTRLHGRLQTGACGPAKGCCPIHKCGADAAVMCTPPQPRGNDHGRPVQPPCRHANHASSNSFKAGSAAAFRSPA